MSLRIKSYQAKGGDAFLITIGKDFNIMVDMGYSSTYREYIKDDFLEIVANGQRINLLIITHIDRDHIRGALSFLRDNDLNQFIKIDDFWYNSYRHIQENIYPDLSSLSNDVDHIKLQDALTKIKQRNKPILDDGIQKASAQEGTSLAGLIYKNEYNWNNYFQKQAIIADINPILFKDAKIYILAPNKEKLSKLEEYWKKELETFMKNPPIVNGEYYDDAFEYFMQNEHVSDARIRKISKKKNELQDLFLENIENNLDPSPTNGSSIAFLLSYKEKKILMLGDAPEDIIYENLLLLKNAGISLDVDIMKLSHHGSINNISDRLIELVNSKYFLTSTDGKTSGHPSLLALAHIIKKQTPYTKHFIFNHKTVEIGDLNNVEHMKKFNYTITYTNIVKI